MKWNPRETEFGTLFLDSLVVTVNTKGLWQWEMPGLICIPSPGQVCALKELPVKLETWACEQVTWCLMTNAQ